MVTVQLSFQQLRDCGSKVCRKLENSGENFGAPKSQRPASHLFPGGQKLKFQNQLLTVHARLQTSSPTFVLPKIRPLSPIKAHTKSKIVRKIADKASRKNHRAGCRPHVFMFGGFETRLEPPHSIQGHFAVHTGLSWSHSDRYWKRKR